MDAINKLAQHGDITIAQKRSAEKFLASSDEVKGVFQSCEVSAFGELRLFFEARIIVLKSDGMVSGSYKRVARFTEASSSKSIHEFRPSE